jgi:hypothetical protein
MCNLQIGNLGVFYMPTLANYEAIQNSTASRASKTIAVPGKDESS